MLATVLEFATMPDVSEYVTIEDAASDKRVPYTAYWIRRLAQEEKIQAIKVGSGARGQWLIHLPSLLEYINRMDELGKQKHNPH
jgi:hypothetical protein